MSPDGGAPPGKGEAGTNPTGDRNNQTAARPNTQQVISSRDDLVPAAVTLVFILLGLLRGEMPEQPDAGAPSTPQERIQLLTDCLTIFVSVNPYC